MRTYFKFLASMPFCFVNAARGMFTGLAETTAAKAIATATENFMMIS